MRACHVGACRRVRWLRPDERAVSGVATGDSGVGTADRAVDRVGRSDPGRNSDADDDDSVGRKWGGQTETPVADRGGAGAAVAAAAIILAIALPALNRSIDRTQRNGHPVVSHHTPVGPDRDSATNAGDSRALDTALAEATAATWDLARSASEPAARISRDVLDAATSPDQPGAGNAAVTGSDSIATTVSVPTLDSLVPDTAAAGAMLQQVGDRLSHGVRPLSDTARHAFGFLLGTTFSKPEAPANPPAQKGA